MLKNSVPLILSAFLLAAAVVFTPSSAESAGKRTEIADNSGMKYYVNSQTVGQYEKFELSFRLPKEYSNPFDPDIVDVQAYFTAPSGKEDIAYGFWYQDYSKETESGKNRHGDIVHRDRYSPQGAPEWKVRYSPLEIGEYKYYITVEDKSGESQYPADNSKLSFNAAGSQSHGFIQVSRKDGDYFVFSNGQMFFPIGHGPEVDFDKLDNYASDKMNIVQTEFVDGFKAGLDFLDKYNPERLYKFDDILEHAEDLGIYLQMGAIAGWPEFAEDKNQMGGNAYWEKNNYNSNNGGPIEFPFQFDSDGKAKKIFKRQLRYYIARWGYSQNVFCWQLWGEFDMRNITASKTGLDYFSERAVIQWHKEMSDYIKSLDSRHLVTTAEAEVTYDKIWQMPSIDFVTIHNYGKTVESTLPEKIQKYQAFNKPIIVQEYGPEALSQGSALSVEAVRAAYHNLLWRTIMMKLAGSAMKWTWYGDAREDKMNMDKDYKIMSGFFAGVDFTNHPADKISIDDLTAKRNFEPVVISKKGINRKLREGGNYSPVEIYGIGNDREAYFWAHDINYNLPQVQYIGYKSKNISGVKFKAGGFGEGNYRVEFWNTLTGEIVKTDTIQAGGNSLTIEVPDFRMDVAVKVKKIA